MEDLHTSDTGNDYGNANVSVIFWLMKNNSCRGTAVPRQGVCVVVEDIPRWVPGLYAQPRSVSQIISLLRTRQSGNDETRACETVQSTGQGPWCPRVFVFVCFWPSNASSNNPCGLKLFLPFPYKHLGSAPLSKVFDCK